jgi:hypothetical protein
MYHAVGVGAPWSMAQQTANGSARPPADVGVGMAGRSVQAEIGVLEQAIEDGRVSSTSWLTRGSGSAIAR